ncbi:MAG TPA: ThuA domain-containing protein [Rugosimonospora sp.]|nr:ThuA domain-containing protein [Rugosimonospora sp.]
MRDELLVFSKTAGYRHDSIPAAVTAIGELGFPVYATEDATVFTGDLSRFGAVVFLSTTGRILDGAQRDGLRGYLLGGGGFAAVHSAANTETGWPFFGGLVGAVFAGHPPLQPGRILVADRDHPATAHLEPEWQWTDEWYDFTTNPGGRVRVLLRVDESSYQGGALGADHPIAWCHEYQGVRCFYTSLGHATEAYQAPALREHLRGGITSVLAGRR